MVFCFLMGSKAQTVPDLAVGVPSSWPPAGPLDGAASFCERHPLSGSPHGPPGGMVCFGCSDVTTPPGLGWGSGSLRAGSSRREGTPPSDPCRWSGDRLFHLSSRVCLLFSGWSSAAGLDPGPLLVGWAGHALLLRTGSWARGRLQAFQIQAWNGFPTRQALAEGTPTPPPSLLL